MINFIFLLNEISMKNKEGKEILHNLCYSKKYYFLLSLIILSLMWYDIDYV